MARQASTDKVHARAMRRFDALARTYLEERRLCLQDRRFAFIAGAQWEGQWLEQFENTIRVEVNKTALGLRKIINDYRANRVTVDFRAVGDKSSEETADLLDGLLRGDVYRSKGAQAFDNAFLEGVSGGMGAWRVTNEYEDEYDPDNDNQCIKIYAIPDADQCVWFDINAKLYDKSDAKYAFVITALSPEAFEDEYGADRLSSWPEGLIKPFYDWFSPEVIRIAEYYEVEDAPDKRRIYTLAVTGEEQRRYASDMDEDDDSHLKVQGWTLKSERPCKRRRVHKYILSGAEVLEDKGYIAGSCIPIIPFYGQRAYIDNVERVKGHVRDAKDPARIYNAQISKLTETAALTPREVPIFAPEQVAGLENHWANMNIMRHPYALANPLLNADGTIVSMGPIGKIEPPQLAPVLAALIQQTANDITELTNTDDGANQAQPNLSADAMDIAATRSDAETAGYMDNFRQSMQRFGEVYQSMASEIYVEEGRKVSKMGEDGEQSEETLMQPHTDDNGKYSIRNDLTQGKYSVISDVTEATTTRRDKTVRMMAGVANVAASLGNQDLGNAALITAVMNMDGEGIDDFQAWARKQALNLGLVKPTPEEEKALADQAQSTQPDPQAQALQGQAAAFLAGAQKDQALAAKAEADTKQSTAKTVLTLAQAHALGGPSEAPQPPDGLEAARTVADIHATNAKTRQTHADAALKERQGAQPITEPA